VIYAPRKKGGRYIAAAAVSLGRKRPRRAYAILVSHRNKMGFDADFCKGFLAYPPRLNGPCGENTTDHAIIRLGRKTLEIAFCRF